MFVISSSPYSVCRSLLSMKLSRGVYGRAVSVIVLESLSPHRFGFESHQGHWIISCEETIQLAYGTTVVLFRCPLIPEIMHGEAPEVLTPPVNLENWHITFTVLVHVKLGYNLANNWGNGHFSELGSLFRIRVIIQNWGHYFKFFLINLSVPDVKRKSPIQMPNNLNEHIFGCKHSTKLLYFVVTFLWKYWLKNTSRALFSFYTFVL